MSTNLQYRLVSSVKTAGMSPEAAAKFDKGVAAARAAGFRVDGVHVAKTVADDGLAAEIEKKLFAAKALKQLDGKVMRIEFFVDGPLPPALLREPDLKSEPMFLQSLNYDLCKGCGLCIEVCPKNVYRDNGFGKPDPTVRFAQNCTGAHQCGKCTDICPENTLAVSYAVESFTSALFVKLPNPFAAEAAAPGKGDFFVVNPTAPLETAHLPATLNPARLADTLKTLDQSGIFPMLNLGGYQRHYVESKDPVGDLKTWAAEQGRRYERVKQALDVVLGKLPQVQPLQQGKYNFDDVIHRVIDEIVLAGVDVSETAGRDLLRGIVVSAYAEGAIQGARRRPIGGLLPPGTSPAWKTPYGEVIPVYTRVEKCLGPECGLCVTHCPEGGGGETSAIRMKTNVPLAIVPALVRGFKVFQWAADAGPGLEAMVDLSAVAPITFEVNEEYCKACGICISCCPHDVIEPAARSFNLREGAAS
jgi:2-oxoglutarate ferredoxin oxidoreductase subunit delta